MRWWFAAIRSSARWWVTGLVTCVVALLSPLPAGAMPAPPVVAPGHALAVRVGGFAAHGPVAVQLVGSGAGRRRVRADADGRVHASYRVPAKLGRYRLLLTGPPHDPAISVAPPSGTEPGDAQVVLVSVPLVVSVPFRVGVQGGSGIGAGGLHHGGASTGGLPSTGSDLREPLLLAAALGLLGLLSTLAGRRRARS